MKSFRIVMNWSRRGSDDAHEVRVFKKGEVYDTRIEGEHGISHTLACRFIQEGAAHEQTAEEWWATIEARRAAKLSDPFFPESDKALIRAQDAYAAPINAIIEAMQEAGLKPATITNPSTYEAKGESL